MVSTSESTFGAKLRRAQDLLNYIQGFTGYAPPRTQETAANFTTLINNIIAANASESSIEQQYRTTVDARQTIFNGKTNSVKKLLAPIKGAVESQFGKKSIETKTITAIIIKMRATKLVKLPKDPADPKQEKKISTSVRSFGSITQMFNDIISTLGQYTSFNPSNNAIKITGLQATSAQATTLNNTIAQKIQALKTIRANRQALYVDLKDRAQRIKSYVKSQYGINSNEFILIKGMQI